MKRLAPDTWGKELLLREIQAFVALKRRCDDGSGSIEHHQFAKALIPLTQPDQFALDYAIGVIDQCILHRVNGRPRAKIRAGAPYRRIEARHLLVGETGKLQANAALKRVAR